MAYTSLASLLLCGLMFLQGTNIETWYPIVCLKTMRYNLAVARGKVVNSRYGPYKAPALCMDCDKFYTDLFLIVKILPISLQNKLFLINTLGLQEANEAVQKVFYLPQRLKITKSPQRL
jgi:hypothetical protein